MKMEKDNQEKDKVKVGFGKFSFEMKGDFVKENGKILVCGVVACGLIAVSGFTYANVYAVTKNGKVAEEVAGNVIKLMPKSV
jgi:predicted negative regulator of RcsB-dependent stress response